MIGAYQNFQNNLGRFEILKNLFNHSLVLRVLDSSIKWPACGYANVDPGALEPRSPGAGGCRAGAHGPDQDEHGVENARNISGSGGKSVDALCPCFPLELEPIPRYLAANEVSLSWRVVLQSCRMCLECLQCDAARLSLLYPS